MVDGVKEMRVGLSRALLHEVRNFQHLSVRFKEHRDMSAGELDTIKQKLKQFESSLCTKYLSSKPANPVGYTTEMKKKTDNVKNKISYFNRVKDLHDRFHSSMSKFQEGCKNIVLRNPSNKSEIEGYISRNAGELAILDRPKSMPEKQQDPWVRLRSLEEYLQYVVDYGVAILKDWESKIPAYNNEYNYDNYNQANYNHNQTADYRSNSYSSDPNYYNSQQQYQAQHPNQQRYEYNDGYNNTASYSQNHNGDYHEYNQQRQQTAPRAEQAQIKSEDNHADEHLKQKKMEEQKRKYEEDKKRQEHQMRLEYEKKEQERIMSLQPRASPQPVKRGLEHKEMPASKKGKLANQTPQTEKSVSPSKIESPAQHIPDVTISLSLATKDIASWGHACEKVYQEYSGWI